MQNKKNILIGVVVVLVLVFGAFLYKYKGKSRVKETPYSMVYLTTGEVYIGKLTVFPAMELKNGYVLATIKDKVDPGKSNFQLNPLDEALWAPKHLYINREQVVFYGPIMSDSLIARKLAEQGK